MNPEQIFVLQDRVVSFVLNPQPGEPDYPNHLRSGYGYCNVLIRVHWTIGAPISLRHYLMESSTWVFPPVGARGSGFATPVILII